MVAEIRSETAKVRAVIKYLSAEEGARRLADAEEMHRRDIADRVVSAREEGLEEGERRGQQKAALQLLRRKISHDEIAAITGLSLDEIMHLENTSSLQ